MDTVEKKPNIILRVLDGLDGFVTAIIMAVIFLDVLLQIVSRLTPGSAFPWTNELGEILLSFLIWIGISAAVKTNNHIGFDLFVSRLSPGGKKFMGIVNMGLFLAYFLILAYLTKGMMDQYLRRMTYTPILQIPTYWVRAPILVGCVLSAIRLIIKEYKIITNRERMYETSLLTE